MDWYKKFLAHAHWTWLEGKFCRYHKKPRRKMRDFGRMEKHAAKQLIRKEIDSDT